MQKSVENDYAVLGVTESTPISQIRTARKKLLATIHPDRFEFNDPRRQTAEEEAKRINEAFESIRHARALPKLSMANEPKSFEPIESKKPRKRLETVESRVVVRDGKVVMIKRKRAIKFARLKDFHASLREKLLQTFEIAEKVLAEKKARSALAHNTPNIRKNVSRVVHIVEGQVKVQRF